MTWIKEFKLIANFGDYRLHKQSSKYIISALKLPKLISITRGKMINKFEENIRMEV